MMIQQKLLLVAIISTVIAGATLVRRPGELGASRSSGLAATWLAMVAGALVVVGIASDTLLRHIVQITPLGLALIVMLRHATWGMSAAAPLFAFWLVLMIGIWVFLLGLARTFPGTYTAIEIELTVVIAAASALGLHSAYRRGRARRVPAELAIVAVFALLQYAAMLASIQLSLS
jgi:hypothetical protein